MDGSEWSSTISMSSVIAPREHHTELVVEAARMLASAVALEGFEAVRGQDAEVAYVMGGVDEIELSVGHGPHVLQAGVASGSGGDPVVDVLAGHGSPTDAIVSLIVR